MGRTYEFDTESTDGGGWGAKDVLVAVPATSKDAGFSSVLSATIEDRKNGQRFAATNMAGGRWVRLTLMNNHQREHRGQVFSVSRLTR